MLLLSPLVSSSGRRRDDSGGNVMVSLTAGALVGVFFRLVFGRVRGKWLGHVFGPEDGDKAVDPGGLSCSP
jgi:hypothetical protein